MVKFGSLSVVALVMVMAGCAPVSQVAESQSHRGSSQIELTLQPASFQTSVETSRALKFAGQSQTKPATKPPKKSPAGQVSHNKAVDQFKQAVKDSGKVVIVVQPPKSGLWKQTDITPAQLAAKVESTLAQQSHVSGSTTVKTEQATGHGGGTGKVLMQDAKNFRADYMWPVLVPKPDSALGFMVANNGKFAVANANGKISNVKPISAIDSAISPDIVTWSAQFGRDLFTGFAGGTPLSRLIAMGKKAGMNISSEEQSFFARNTTIYQQRLVLTRTPAAAKKLGRLDIEVIADGHLHLPVTIRTSYEPPKKPPVRVYWTMRWNLKPGQQFEAKDFALPSQKVAREPVKSAKA